MTEITDEQIEELRAEALNAGDTAQAAICEYALGHDRREDAPFGPMYTREQAREECARVIDEASARETLDG